MFGLSQALCPICLPTWMSQISQDMSSNAWWSISLKSNSNQNLVYVETNHFPDPPDCIHHWLTQLTCRTLVSLEMPLEIYLPLLVVTSYSRRPQDSCRSCDILAISSWASQTGVSRACEVLFLWIRESIMWQLCQNNFLWGSLWSAIQPLVPLLSTELNAVSITYYQYSSP